MNNTETVYQINKYISILKDSIEIMMVFDDTYIKVSIFCVSNE